jgi:hypothetical protein
VSIDLVIAIICMILSGILIAYLSFVWAILVGVYQIFWIGFWLLNDLFHKKALAFDNILINIISGLKSTFEALIYIPVESWQFARYDHPYIALVISICIVSWLDNALQDRQLAQNWRVKK